MRHIGCYLFPNLSEDSRQSLLLTQSCKTLTVFKYTRAIHLGDKFWIHISKDKSDILEFLVGVCQPHASFILLKPPCDQLPVQEEHSAGADEDCRDFSSDGLFSQPVAFCSWVVIREEMKLVSNNLACTYTVTGSFFLQAKIFLSGS